jgi:hypothetical protein
MAPQCYHRALGLQGPVTGASCGLHANRGAVKRQSGTRTRRPEAPVAGILGEKLVFRGRTR